MKIKRIFGKIIRLGAKSPIRALRRGPLVNTYLEEKRASRPLKTRVGGSRLRRVRGVPSFIVLICAGAPLCSAQMYISEHLSTWPPLLNPSSLKAASLNRDSLNAALLNKPSLNAASLKRDSLNRASLILGITEQGFTEGGFSARPPASRPVRQFLKEGKIPHKRKKPKKLGAGPKEGGALR